MCNLWGNISQWYLFHVLPDRWSEKISIRDHSCSSCVELQSSIRPLAILVLRWSIRDDFLPAFPTSKIIFWDSNLSLHLNTFPPFSDLWSNRWSQIMLYFHSNMTSFFTALTYCSKLSQSNVLVSWWVNLLFLFLLMFLLLNHSCWSLEIAKTTWLYYASFQCWKRKKYSYYVENIFRLKWMIIVILIWL